MCESGGEGLGEWGEKGGKTEGENMVVRGGGRVWGKTRCGLGYSSAASGVYKSQKVVQWLKRELRTEVPKVGANLLYDLGFLQTEGIKVAGPLYASLLYTSGAADESPCVYLGGRR